MLVEKERCGQCGEPRWVCQSDDPDIDFEIIVEECHATQARDRAEKSRNKGKKEAPAGIALGTEPYTYSRTPIDNLREAFYEQKTKERDEKLKTRPVIPRSDAD